MVIFALTLTGLTPESDAAIDLKSDGSAEFAGVVSCEEYLELGGRGGSNGVVLVKNANDGDSRYLHY